MTIADSCMLAKDILFCSLDTLSGFRKDRGRKFILFDTPVHGNLGDHAIAVAELKLLRDICGSHIYEFPGCEYYRFRHFISKYISPDDVILIHGGGFIGTLWAREEDTFIRILDMFSQNKIIVFPQTVYFEDSERGARECRRFYQAISKCRDFTLFVREKHSHEYMRLHFPSVRTFCVPDLATYLDFPFHCRRTKTALFCMRKDHEKTLTPETAALCQEKLRAHGYSAAFTDTIAEHPVTRATREKELHKKLTEFAKASVVVTDRLHGMLFSAITGTPCLAFDNASHKVSGVHEWISGLGYISMADPSDDIDTCLQTVLEHPGAIYDNGKFDFHYGLIQKVIEEK